MPYDIGVLKKLDKASLSAAELKSYGNTAYSWETYSGDFQLDTLNELILVEGTSALAQAIFKIVLTPKGSNTEDPNYGTVLEDLPGSRMDNEKYAAIQSAVIDALIHYNTINQDNPNSDEVIETIDLIRVVANPDDGRSINIQIAVTTESGKPVKIEVPQVL
jgi:phage baseplate assembly protein W